MLPLDVAPIARILNDAYMATGSYSRLFKAQYGSPPTIQSKVHHLRSIVQIAVRKHVDYDLDEEYTEQGRVHILDVASGLTLALRSSRAVEIEGRPEKLFDDRQFVTADALLLVYTFSKEGLELGTAAAARRNGVGRLLPVEPPSVCGSWRYEELLDPGRPFDQSGAETFLELGTPDLAADDQT